nr:RNA-directed DNA polymerase, eukaryota [Tanacetum cinerariifolium]
MGENFVNYAADEEIKVGEGVSDNKKSKGDKGESISSGRFKKSEAPRSGGSFLNLMEEVVNVGLGQKAKKDWARELCVKNKVNFLAIQETKKEKIDLFCVRRCWGNSSFDHLHSNSVGNSGVAWREIIMGDFNEVRYKSDWFGSNFNSQSADAFNSFIDNAVLEEIFIRSSATDFDFGPIPFRFFHHWFEIDGFYKFVFETWCSAPIDRSNGMCNMAGNLKFLKNKIREWVKSKRCEGKVLSDNLKEELQLVDDVIDLGSGNDEVVQKRVEIVNFLRKIDHMQAMDMAQKTKLKWAIEGDENSSFFHGMLNKKQNQSNIRGIMVDGMWKDRPVDIKKEFLNHFRSRFGKPVERRATIDMSYPRSLSDEQRDEIEREVSKEEIKTINDVYVAVNHFFNNGDIPASCNASFIALIPKIPDANLVKDFRPISLIGSIYKIIAKILANRLVTVLGDIVNEVQSAFIVGRQIMDGPFILNEVLHWGSILVNGSPTEEFQFFKGLKQGDPISPFLFILIMESLHLSFQRVIDAGIFKGTKVGEAMSQIQAWKEVVEKVKSRLSKWKMKTLSIGGRLTLLKSVLGSIPIFPMSMFRVPAKVLQVLESIRGQFFNGHEMGSNKASWVKWTNVLMDKKHGGLGVSNLYALNRSLMIKWIRRFFTQKESLWVKVISAIHGDNDKAESRCHAIGRSCWLSIVNEVRILKNKGMNIFDFMYLKLGNGDKVKFWTDHWFARGIIKDICPRLFALENCKDIFVSAKMNDNNLESSFRRKSRGDVEQVQMVSLVEAVSTINLVPMDDRWTWNLESSGEFLVASARKKIDELRFPNIKDATRRGIDIQSLSCPICEIGVESSDHVFFKCHLVRDIGWKIARRWNRNYVEVNSYDEWKTWLTSCRMEAKLKQMFEGV